MQNYHQVQCESLFTDNCTVFAIALGYNRLKLIECKRMIAALRHPQSNDFGDNCLKML